MNRRELLASLAAVVLPAAFVRKAQERGHEALVVCTWPTWKGVDTVDCLDVLDAVEAEAARRGWSLVRRELETGERARLVVCKSGSMAWARAQERAVFEDYDRKEHRFELDGVEPGREGSCVHALIVQAL